MIYLYPLTAHMLAGDLNAHTGRTNEDLHLKSFREQLLNNSMKYLFEPCKSKDSKINSAGKRPASLTVNNGLTRVTGCLWFTEKGTIHTSITAVLA